MILLHEVMLDSWTYNANGMQVGWKPMVRAGGWLAYVQSTAWSVTLTALNTVSIWIPSLALVLGWEHAPEKSAEENILLGSRTSNAERQACKAGAGFQKSFAPVHARKWAPSSLYQYFCCMGSHICQDDVSQNDGPEGGMASAANRVAQSSLRC